MSQQEALDSFEEIEQASKVLSQGRRPFMQSLDLFSLWHHRLEKAALLKPLELKDLRLFCLEVLSLKECLEEANSLWAQKLSQPLFNPEEPLSAIDQIMTASGDIRSDASETLFKLHNENQRLKQSIHNTLDRISKLHELDPVLQDRFVTTREGRWVLPVKSGMQHQFKGIIHGSSQSKQTVFMEPEEVVSLNNQLKLNESLIEGEIEHLLEELAEYLQSKTKQFEAAFKVMLELDQTFAKAQLSLQLEAVPCEFDDGAVQLTGLRHPLLALASPLKVVTNDVRLDAEKRILLLSGPNAGGKTVLLKSVGLAAQMARCGLPICADKHSRLPFFKAMIVSVGDDQSVDQNLSTFAAHLKLLQEALLISGPSSLLLIDEICGSTDPEEGAALARAFIESYTEQKVFAVITSHLGPLKLGWSPSQGVVNGSLEYNAETGLPTYQFIMGVAGQSLAIKTAKRVGVAHEIIERAKNHLSPEVRAQMMAQISLEEQKAEIHQLRKQLNVELKGARESRQKYEQLLKKIESEKSLILEKSIARAENKLSQLVETVRAEEIFKKHGQLEEMRQRLPEIIKTSKSSRSNEEAIDSAESFIERFPPGSKVFASTLGRDAVVQGQPNSKGEIPVLSQSMRLLIHWHLLKPPQQPENAIRKTMATRANLGPLPQTDRVVDVRGQTVEEALRHLEDQIDQALLCSEDRIKVLHGHGSEVLKKQVRQYLARSLSVSSWRAGGKESGGDGVTWAEFA